MDRTKAVPCELLQLALETLDKDLLIGENVPTLLSQLDAIAKTTGHHLQVNYDDQKKTRALKTALEQDANPDAIKSMNLKKRYGIFLQKFFVYKINIFNQYETPWEGTRICKKKFLRDFTQLRKDIRAKNLQKPFWNLKYEKSIDLINNGGWHFNNLYDVEIIAKKLKTFQHTEFNHESYSSIEVIKEKILNLEDLFGRNHKYKKISINDEFPEYIRTNLDNFKNFIA